MNPPTMPDTPNCIVQVHPTIARLILSRCGRIWLYRDRRRFPLRNPRWLELKGCADKDGHIVIGPLVDGKRTQLRLHVLVLETFVSPKPPGMMGCHRNDIPTDNRVSNLYWGTMKDNATDSVRNGRTFRGERCHAAKLTASQVQEIRRRYALGGISQQALGDQYGLPQETISAVVRRKSWTHI